MIHLVGASFRIPKAWGFNPHLGHIGDSTDQCLSLTSMFLSLSLSLSLFLPLSLKSINISSDEDHKTKINKLNRKLERGRSQLMKGFLWDWYSSIWILSWKKVNESYDTIQIWLLEAGKVNGAGATSRQWGLGTGTAESSNRKANTPFPINLYMKQFVWLQEKGEFCGPATEETTSLTSCNLLWLQFHPVAVGCEELFHRSIMVKGFALMKNFESVSRSCSSCVFF